MEPQFELLDLLGQMDGFRQVRGNQRPPNWNSRLTEAIRLLSNADGYSSYYWKYRVSEAVTASDWSYLFSDILDRQLLARYTETPQVMSRIVRINRNVPDFRLVKRNRVDGSEGRLQVVTELGEYKQSELTEAEYDYSVRKYGRGFSLSWEAMINDDIGVYQSLPERYGRSARRTEEWFLTNLFFDTTGPRSAYFAGNGGASSLSTLPLTPQNLVDAVTEMHQFTDTESEPIFVNPTYLVVPPALSMEATKILNSAIMISGENKTQPNMNVASLLNLEILTNPWIPLVVTSGTVGKTCWALFTSPNDIPAGEFGLLAGHNSPEIFLRASNQVSVSGGDVSPMNGSFENDSIHYKVRHVLGGTRLEGRAGWASTGQG